MPSNPLQLPQQQLQTVLLLLLRAAMLRRCPSRQPARVLTASGRPLETSKFEQMVLKCIVGTSMHRMFECGRVRTALQAAAAAPRHALPAAVVAAFDALMAASTVTRAKEALDERIAFDNFIFGNLDSTAAACFPANARLHARKGQV